MHEDHGGPAPRRVRLCIEELCVHLDAIGRAKWHELTKEAKPSLTRATRDGTHPEDTTGLLPPAFIKSGEYMFELRLPGSGLDDVILFVLREVGGKWQVAAHWADY